MAGLTRGHLKAVHELLYHRKDKVAANAQWQTICAQLELSPPRQGKFLLFDGALRKELRQVAEAVTGYDLMSPLPEGDRNLYAKAGFLNEKVSPVKPNQGYVLLKGQIPGLPQLDPAVSVRLPLTSLALGALETLVVMENLDSFDSWHRYLVPAELQQATVLYRGHGTMAGSKALLAELPASVRLVAFTDLDPAGLRTAHAELKAQALLTPQLSSSLIKVSVRDDFNHQHEAQAYLEKAELGGWQALWERVKAAKLSIKQQHMLAQAVPLTLLQR